MQVETLKYIPQCFGSCHQRRDGKFTLQPKSTRYKRQFIYNAAF